MRGAFIYIIEVVMLVTALVGPIFVALSLFPSGSKFLLNWGASFLSLGFCKICYSLISGLSALAMVYVGPKNSDMLVISLVLGLFAPVLSFGIASGSGISILGTMSSVGQSYGVNTGIGGYHNNSYGKKNRARGTDDGIT
jgi:ABC-type transport system involved in cytochrome c biogenesis permease component